MYTHSLGMSPSPNTQFVLKLFLVFHLPIIQHCSLAVIIGEQNMHTAHSPLCYWLPPLPLDLLPFKLCPSFLISSFPILSYTSHLFFCVSLWDAFLDCYYLINSHWFLLSLWQICHRCSSPYQPLSLTIVTYIPLNSSFSPSISIFSELPTGMLYCCFLPFCTAVITFSEPLLHFYTHFSFSFHSTHPPWFFVHILLYSVCILRVCSDTLPPPSLSSF